MAVPKILILIGVSIAVIGLVLHVFPHAFAWFGRLPGDIRIEGERTSIYIPITSMLLLSAAVTIIIRFLSK
ncbi:MAG: DUF2905 domain-containing protein [Deltaproteobacteria bacterium]|nr:DUF2905 domain-containing protein [Deltaproteobacteria bacterium]